MKQFIAGIFVGFIIFCFFWSFMDGVVKQEEIRETALEKKIRRTAVGNHVDLAGCGFLKTRGVKR